MLKEKEREYGFIKQWETIGDPVMLWNSPEDVQVHSYYWVILIQECVQHVMYSAITS